MREADGAHAVPPMTKRDRVKAQVELWRADGIRGELHDARIVAWNVWSLLRVLTKR